MSYVTTRACTWPFFTRKYGHSPQKKGRRRREKGERRWVLARSSSTVDAPPRFSRKPPKKVCLRRKKLLAALAPEAALPPAAKPLPPSRPLPARTAAGVNREVRRTFSGLLSGRRRRRALSLSLRTAGPDLGQKGKIKDAFDMVIDSCMVTYQIDTKTEGPALCYSTLLPPCPA
jgi:hypothetical protein